MPLGNGDIGVNAWVEPSGDLLFYVGKTDAWSENGDFRLRPDAPVFSKIPGFKPVPFERMGLYRDAYRTNLPPKKKTESYR